MANAKGHIDNVIVDMGVNTDDRTTQSPLSRASILRYLNEAQEELGYRVAKIKEDYLVTRKAYTAPWPTEQQLPLPDDALINKIRLVQWIRQDDHCDLKRLTLMEYASTSAWRTPPVTSVPYGWRPFDEEGGPTRIGILPDRSLQVGDSVRMYYVRKIPPLDMEGDTPFFPESGTYLEDYAKWRIALVDPSRTVEAYEAKYENSLRNLMETFTDRTPQDGGTALELSDEDLSMSYEPTMDL